MDLMNLSYASWKGLGISIGSAMEIIFDLERDSVCSRGGDRLESRMVVALLFSPCSALAFFKADYIAAAFSLQSL